MKKRKTKKASKKFRSLSRFAKGAFAVSKSDLSPTKLRMLKGLLKNRRRGLRRNPKATDGMTPREKLRYYVSGAIERGEGKAIAGMPTMTMKRLKTPRPGYEYNVQGYYSGQWEDVDAHDNRYDAIQSRKNYDANERQYPHRVIVRRIKANRRRSLRRNEEYAPQIPRRDRPMRGRGFDKRFDVSAGSEYKHLQNFLATGRPAGMKSERKLGANTLVRRYNDGSIGVILYSTRILHYKTNGDVDVNFGGYMTTTTFSRINALIPYGWNLRKKAGKLALENSWGQRAIIRKPREGEEYSVRLTSDKAYLID